MEQKSELFCLDSSILSIYQNSIYQNSIRVCARVSMHLGHFLEILPSRRLGVCLPARLRFYHLSAMPLPCGVLATSPSMLAKLPRSSLHDIMQKTWQAKQKKKTKGTWSCWHGWSFQYNISHRPLCCLRFLVEHTCTLHNMFHMLSCISLASTVDCTSLCTILHNLHHFTHLIEKYFVNLT